MNDEMYCENSERPDVSHAEDFPPKDHYDNPKHQRFVDELKAAGYAPCDYQGRFFYKGPGVVVDGTEIDHVREAVSMTLQKDNMAFDWVLYPRAFFNCDIDEHKCSTCGREVTDLHVHTWQDDDGLVFMEAECTECFGKTREHFSRDSHSEGKR